MISEFLESNTLCPIGKVTSKRMAPDEIATLSSNIGSPVVEAGYPDDASMLHVLELVNSSIPAEFIVFGEHEDPEVLRRMLQRLQSTPTLGTVFFNGTSSAVMRRGALICAERIFLNYGPQDIFSLHTLAAAIEESGWTVDGWTEDELQPGQHQWREKAQERRRQRDLLCSAAAPMRVLTFYDVKGWAWYHRARQLALHLGPDIVLDIKQYNEPFDEREYDLIMLFEHYLYTRIKSPVSPGKLILGNSAPVFLDRAIRRLQELPGVPGFANNYQTYHKLKSYCRAYCCQNGVDLQLFHPAKEPPKEIAACFVGNSKNPGAKGVDLIQAACGRENVQLLCFDTLDAKPAEHNPQSWLRDEYYHRASVYICASAAEGTPNPALEALACGVPVISTAVGNMPEVIIDGYNGFIVERSADAIAAALQKLKTGDRELLSCNARRSVEYGWSWPEQALKYRAMFFDVLRRRM